MKRGAGIKVALPALLGALSLAILYAACLIPTGTWGLAALAGLTPAAAVIAGGLRGGFLCWGGVSILAAVLLPDKFVAALFAALFGLYPMVKSLAERIKAPVLRWAVKLVFFNLAFTVLYMALGALMLNTLPGVFGAVWLLYGAGNVVFVLYDLGFSRLIGFYLRRLWPALKRTG